MKINAFTATILGLGFLVYTFAVWSIGFNRGADVALCAFTYLETGNKLEDIPVCDSVNVDSPFTYLRANLPEILK